LSETFLPAPIRDAAELILRTLETLGKRAPSVVADAARELGREVLALNFGDGSHATLRSDQNTMRVARDRPPDATVEVFMNDRSLQLLFDYEQRPSQILAYGEFDARGAAPAVLAAWRTFQLLSQRAAGLRTVQSIWMEYRRRIPPDPSYMPDLSPPGPGRMPDATELLHGPVAEEVSTASVATNCVLWDGRNGAGWWTVPGPKDADLFEVMDACQRRAVLEIEHSIPQREPRDALYDLMRDYPRRGGKGLRALLCMACCRAFGGREEDAVLTAAAIEMFHNAFLIHDDIEDESLSRRRSPCLHADHGIALAVNAGDAMNLLAVQTVLSNIEQLGLARTLGLIQEIIHMCWETVEGQAIELGWIRRCDVPGSDEVYVDMVTKKTGWYTCISPCRLGAVAAGYTRPAELDLLGLAFQPVGVAFQIQDDILNLIGEESLYGKEALGDLLEGKRTLMLIHLMRSLVGNERDSVLKWLALPRGQKSFADAQWLVSLMQRQGSIEYGRVSAAKFAARAANLFDEQLGFIPESEGKALLRQVIHYVNTRPL
jgi:geranylgeranyl diphosphate synthase type II